MNIKKETIPRLRAKLDRVFAQYIRMRDSVPYKGNLFRCISCGRILPVAQEDCGHYINRSILSVRYDETNCNGQCRHCNRFREGNAADYRHNLITKYGENSVKLLELRAHNRCIMNETAYKALIDLYTQKVKELKTILRNGR